MFLIQEDVIKDYPPPVRALLVGIALVILSLVFYSYFYEDIYKILFTDEPKEPSDYAEFVLAIAIVIIIISTLFRFIRHMRELRQNDKIE